jgi:hypothetical protein
MFIHLRGVYTKDGIDVVRRRAYKIEWILTVSYDIVRHSTHFSCKLALNEIYALRISPMCCCGKEIPKYFLKGHTESTPSQIMTNAEYRRKLR